MGLIVVVFLIILIQDVNGYLKHMHQSNAFIHTYMLFKEYDNLEYSKGIQLKTNIHSVDSMNTIKWMKRIVICNIFGLILLNNVNININNNNILLIPTIAYAREAKTMRFDDLNRLKYGLKEVNFLLDHWEEKTTYCNYGELQRELLSPENKEKLLEAAALTGLLDYDKSATMNVMCRKDPQVVRGFLGLTGKSSSSSSSYCDKSYNSMTLLRYFSHIATLSFTLIMKIFYQLDDNLVLNKAELLMKKPSTLELIDSDDIDTYIDQVDVYTQAISAIDVLSYQARSDFYSQETNSKDTIELNDKNNNEKNKKDYLALTRDNVIIARDALTYIVYKIHL